MALVGTVKWDSRLKQATALGIKGKGGPQHAGEHTKPYPGGVACIYHIFSLPLSR